MDNEKVKGKIAPKVEIFVNVGNSDVKASHAIDNPSYTGKQ
jgi:hypothetical protein